MTALMTRTLGSLTVDDMNKTVTVTTPDGGVVVVDRISSILHYAGKTTVWHWHRRDGYTGPWTAECVVT